jgi:hypothetical protein
LAAQVEFENYKPSRADRMFKRGESKIEELKNAITEAQRVEDEQHRKALETHEKELAEWKEMTELAERILSDEPEAHLEAIERLDPFSEISQLGSSINFTFNGDLIEIKLHVNGEEIIPSESKTLLKSGKLSIKKIPQGKFYELYQDYVCGAVLRVARELFSLLPIEMVIVTATGTMLNSNTGHMEEQPILSVAIPRKTLEILNIDMIDPSDSMTNFVHRMNFKKTTGFVIVEPISPEEIKS